MTNHVHLLLTPGREDAIGRLRQYLGWHYVLYINHRYDRSGMLWEGRYKASLVQEDDYRLAGYRYIELNPVRAGMVKGPRRYRRSSYHRNAMGGGPDRCFARALPGTGRQRGGAPADLSGLM